MSEDVSGYAQSRAPPARRARPGADRPRGLPGRDGRPAGRPRALGRRPLPRSPPTGAAGARSRAATRWPPPSGSPCRTAWLPGGCRSSATSSAARCPISRPAARPSAGGGSGVARRRARALRRVRGRPRRRRDLPSLALSPLRLRLARRGGRPRARARRLSRSFGSSAGATSTTSCWPRGRRRSARTCGRAQQAGATTRTCSRPGAKAGRVIPSSTRACDSSGRVHAQRARLVTGSFLTKHLGIDWRRGAEHFFAHLVDGDVANNIGNWQWVAGTGTDSRPNRMLSPIRRRSASIRPPVRAPLHPRARHARLSGADRGARGGGRPLPRGSRMRGWETTERVLESGGFESRQRVVVDEAVVDVGLRRSHARRHVLAGRRPRHARRRPRELERRGRQAEAARRRDAAHLRSAGADRRRRRRLVPPRDPWRPARAPRRGLGHARANGGRRRLRAQRRRRGVRAAARCSSRGTVVDGCSTRRCRARSTPPSAGATSLLVRSRAA